MSESTGPHAGCEICRTIPDRLSSTTKGDETWGDPFPPALARLAIVGAPYYDGDTSRSNWALHRCPLCGTFYSWKFEYEYLAGGSEDSTLYTRLDAETGARLESKVLADVEAARERSRQRAAALVAAIAASPEDKAVYDAARFANEARRWGFDVDLARAVPALVERLASLPRGGGPGILRYDLRDLLFPWVGTSPERAREVLRLLAARGREERGEDATELAAHCERLLADEPAAPR